MATSRTARDPTQGRPGKLGSSVGASGDANDFGLGTQRRLFFGRRLCGGVLQRSHWLCLNQHGAFNSPVWFNVGLYHQYGIGKGCGQGNYFFNRDAGEAERAPTQYEYPQASACFIQSVDDTMEDIMRLGDERGNAFQVWERHRIGFSTLRSTREKLSGGGRPSGPLSFLKVYDQVANVVKSGGKTRRAAKMNTLKDWHPDIEEFIEAKAKEEKKAWALIEQGYDGSYNGEAYGSIMYQNENLSVRVSDEFMQRGDRGQGMVDA